MQDDKQDYDWKQDYKRRWIKVFWVVAIGFALLMTPKFLFWPVVAIVGTILAVTYVNRRKDRR